MVETIEDVNSRTLLQQFHELYNKQNETETDVENLDAKIDQETLERQTTDLSLNSEIQALRDQIESLGVLFTYKGEVATIQDLPVTDNKPGDVYYVDSEQSGYVWLEKSGVYQWEEFGPAIDLSEYAKQEDLEQLEDQVTAMGTQVGNNTTFIENLTNTKQDKLTAGTNITIQNNVISASGGLTEVTASDVNSEQATQGQVLTADGSGGASWQNASGGDKLYLHNISPNFDIEMRVRILTKSPTTFTTSTLAQYLYSNYNAGVPFEYTFLNNNIICIGKRLESNNGLDCRIRYKKITQSIVDNTISNSQSAIQYDINFAVNSDTVIEL